MLKEKIGLDVIGYGGMGSWHMRQAVEHLSDKFINIGTFDIREERQQLARENGMIAFESRRALLSCPDIELVVVATPNDVHREIVLDALRHGKNVICEKPVTMSMADLEDMVAVANEIIETNSLGSVFSIESRVYGSRRIPGDWCNNWYSNTFDLCHFEQKESTDSFPLYNRVPKCIFFCDNITTAIAYGSRKYPLRI